jgi:hypothetical protein
MERERYRQLYRIVWAMASIFAVRTHSTPPGGS